MAAIEKSDAMLAAEAIRDAFKEGVAGQADLYDVMDVVDVASSDPEAFGGDPAEASRYQDYVLTSYFNASFSRYADIIENRAAAKIDADENSYLEAISAAAEVPGDEMDRLLAEADLGLTSRLREAEAALYYR